MRAYIVGGGIDGTEEVNGVYHLVTEDGVCWATQWCKNFDDARKELYEDRVGLKEDWRAKYVSEVEVFRLGDDAMTFERLAERQMGYTPTRKGQLPDGVYYCIVTVKNGHWEKSDPKPVRDIGHLVVEAMLNGGNTK